MTSLAPTINETGAIFQSCTLGPTAHTGRNLLDKKQFSTPKRIDVAITNPTDTTNKKKTMRTTPWDIGSIEDLPDAANIFPLERTRVSLDDKNNNADASPNEIGQIICNCLRDLSITIISKRRNKLLAESIDRDVRFVVKLYKEQSDSNGSYHVMVEIQKRRGCSLSFGHVAHVLLQAAKSGNSSHVEEEEDKGNDAPLPQHQLNHQIVNTDKYPANMEEESDSLSCDLKHIADLIKDNQMDVSLLGMQDLVILTNTEITNQATALRVAKLVLQNGNGRKESDGDLGFNGLIKRFICENSHGDIDRLWEDDFEKWYLDRMHYCALTVLANSLFVVWSDCHKNGNVAYLQQMVVSEGWLDESNGLLSMLTKELASTEKRPHNAYQAIRCMNILFQVSSPEVSKRAAELRVPYAIHSSQNVGRCCYSLLAHGSENAMGSSFGSSHRPIIRHESWAVECTI